MSEEEVRVKAPRRKQNAVVSAIQTAVEIGSVVYGPGGKMRIVFALGQIGLRKIF